MLLTLPLAFDLGQVPLQTDDEARQAVNALEMLRSNGQWLVTTFNHQPDLWNTKPPLLIWLQALSMHWLGPTALAVRVPSLLADVGILGWLYLAGRRLGKPGIGLLAGGVLVTMGGFRSPHVARSGDYDALLCCWVLGQLVATFIYVETGRARYLVLAAGTVGAAVLTKGVAGLLGVPSLALYLLLEKKLWATLRKPECWLAVATALVGPVLFYALREHALPGYLAAVWNNELGGRFAHDLINEVLPGCPTGTGLPPISTLFYVRDFFGYQCQLWVPFLPLAGLLVFAPPPVRRLGVLLSVFIISWMLLITLSKTKHYWYVAPMMPALALLIALGMGAAYGHVRTWLPATIRYARWSQLLGGALAIALLVLPYGRAFYWLLLERQSTMVWGSEHAYSTYVRDYQPAKTPAHLLIYYPNCYIGGLQFYQEVSVSRGLLLQTYSPSELPLTLAPGAQVLVCMPDLRARLLQHYAVRLVDQRESCTLYEVTGPAAEPLATN
ncbi:glycosyltransferase family 39 protein [Hymenobacter sp. BT559]|uniref:ArnT family glycosyltransferase n=1 Tax=Hymenobacter sp. BT559 TaxID=2795729 RepID=UPI0018EC7CBC|nr:glycosyltransferase family 39 protein [Hymenobacter sp. BT559]